MIFNKLIQSKIINFNRTSSKRLFCLTSSCASAAKLAQQEAALSNEEKIMVPFRVKRDELSVLKAMSSTVKLSYRSPHLKYIDDPFLIPGSNTDKRIYSLAKASGQKAARYVVEQYPRTFGHDPSQPPVEALMPTTEMQCSIDSMEGLLERLGALKPLDSYESYQNLKQAGVDVPMETVEDLLDLLCFYNSENPPSEQLLAEELFFLRDVSPDSMKKKRKDWKDVGAAENMYKELSEPSVRATCSLIRGRAKFNDASGAYELFNDQRQKNVKLDVKTYNAVLGVTFFLRDSAESRWLLIQDLLKDMAAAEVAPDIDTFNTVLGVLARCNRFTKVITWSQLVLNEMHKCQIEPTLTTWTHILNANYPSADSQSPVIYQIIEHLQGKSLKLHQPSDYGFFSAAMSFCFNSFKDLKLALDIKALSEVGGNRLLLGDNFRQAVYHTHYLRILCLCDHLDNVMKHYDEIVPHAYTPTFSVLSQLLTAIELHEGYSYLPRLWSDFVVFKYTRRTDLIQQLVSIMAKKKQSQELQEVFVKIVQNIQMISETDSQARRTISPLILNGVMIGDMVQIHLFADNFTQAWDLLQLYKQNQRQISGFPSEKSLASLAQVCIAQQDVDKCLEVLSLMSDFAYPKLDKLVAEVNETMQLTDHERSHLDDLL